MEPDTETDDMASYQSKGDVQWWDLIERTAVSWGRHLWVYAGASALILVTIGVSTSNKNFSTIAQIVLIVSGGLQILLGVYLTSSQRSFISRFIDQESLRQTVAVRDVRLTREIIALLKKLRGCGGLSELQWKSEIDEIISCYAKRKDEQKSKFPRMLRLSSKDVAVALQSAFTHAFFGTLVALAGTAIATFPDQWFT
ncbi:hypothetical protein [Xanthomonas citri]